MSDIFYKEGNGLSNSNLYNKGEFIEKTIIQKLDADKLFDNESSNVELYLIKYDNYLDIKKRYKRNNTSISNSDSFLSILNFTKDLESNIIDDMNKYSIKLNNHNNMNDLLITLLNNKKIYKYIENRLIQLLVDYGFINNVYDDDNNPKNECSIFYLLYDLISIYNCYYLFDALQKEEIYELDNILLLYSLLNNYNEEKHIINYIDNYLKEKENNSFIKYSSTYNKNQKIWEEETKYENIIQQCVMKLRHVLSTNYLDMDYYICENCGKPFIRTNKNQKVHSEEQDYECRKSYDRKRQKKSYYKKKANK